MGNNIEKVMIADVMNQQTQDEIKLPPGQCSSLIWGSFYIDKIKNPKTNPHRQRHG
jgi:hypothetical protein